MSQITQVFNGQLFASPVFGYELADFGPLNQALLADCAVRRATDKGVSVSNRLGWHSETDLFQRKEESFRTLCAQISKVLIHVAQTTAPSFNLSAHDIHRCGWVNINPKGSFNTPHDHNGFHWSGCYYVSVPETQVHQSGIIEFLDPRGGTGILLPNDTALFQSQFQVRPRAGQMLIFPSFLRHWVYPNQDDEERVSIAFNARIEARASPRVA